MGKYWVDGGVTGRDTSKYRSNLYPPIRKAPQKEGEPIWKATLNQAIADGILTNNEVEQIIRDYDTESYVQDMELKKVLAKRGYNISISPMHEIVITPTEKVQYVDTSTWKEARFIPRLRLRPITKRRIIWLSIIGPTILTCLWRLMR